jgi:DNA relaxase NicK
MSLLASSSELQPKTATSTVPPVLDPPHDGPQMRKPPTANRGVIPQDPRRELIPTIDYLTFVLTPATLDQFVELSEEITAIAGIVWEDCPSTGRSVGTYYPSHLKTEDGSIFCYRINEKNPEFLDLICQLSGTACRRAGTSAIAGLIRLIYMQGGQLSRLDVNVDDFMRDLSYDELMKASYEGRYTRFRKSVRFDANSIRSKAGGFTISFGDRASDRYVRVYDAKAKHGIDAIRFEAEFKGAIANAIGKMITTVTTDEILSKLLGGILNGTIRITESTRNHNTNRIANSPFWQRFSDRLSTAIRVSSPKREVTIENTINYVRNIVAKPLAKFIAYYGCHWADELKAIIKAGRSRFDRGDFAALEGCTYDGFLRFWDDLGYTVDIPAWEHQIRNWVTPSDQEIYDIPF